MQAMTATSTPRHSKTMAALPAAVAAATVVSDLASVVIARIAHGAGVTHSFAPLHFATYTTLTLPLQAGDRLVLYTDGMLEATNVDQEEFGPERLHDIVRATADLTHTEAADQIISSIQHWSAIQNDDLTIILCDYTA